VRVPVLLGVVVLIAVVAIVVAITSGTPPTPSDAPVADEERTDGKPRKAPGPAPAPLDRPREPRPAPVEPDRPPPVLWHLAGKVIDETDRPVEGAAILVRLGEEAVAVAVTDAEGGFDRRVPGPVAEVLAQGGPGYGDSAAVKPDGPDGPALTLRVERRLLIHGTIVDDASGEPVAEATLLLRRAGAEDARGWPQTGSRFALAGLEAGTYVLTVNVSGYDGWTSDEITISKESPHARLDVRVTRTGPWGAITVRPVGPDGEAIPRVNRAYLHNPETGSLALSRPGAATPVRLEAPGGRHVLYVAVDGYQREARIVEVPEGGDAEITVTLEKAGHVEIRVRDADDRPLPDYRLRIFDPEGAEIEYEVRLVEAEAEAEAEPEAPAKAEAPPRSGPVGKNQQIEFSDARLMNLPPGRYRLVATKEGMNPAEESVDVEVGRTASVTLTLR
jgi:hypothetical protein